MRPFCRGLRRIWIVTLGDGVKALNLLGWRGEDARAGMGIEVVAARISGSMQFHNEQALSPHRATCLHKHSKHAYWGWL